jgi:hypothetical protein
MQRVGHEPLAWCARVCERTCGKAHLISSSRPLVAGFTPHRDGASMMCMSSPGPPAVLSEDGPDSTGWQDFIREVLAKDARAQAQIGAEHLDPEAVVRTAVRLATSETSLDMSARFTELKLAGELSAAALSSLGSRKLIRIQAMLGLSLLLKSGAAFFALISILVIGTDPSAWLSSLITMFTACGLVGVARLVSRSVGSMRDEQLRRASLGQSVLDAERLKSNLAEQVQSLLIIPALERAAALQFVRPAEDVIRLTKAAHMSARVEPMKRIQTASYRRVLLNLRRAGGATIGLAGSRGVGKSELLRSFCDHPFERASIESGGNIGIVVAAPVVYEPQSFLRLVIRRLAEKVPGNDATAEPHRGWMMSGADLATFAAVMACLAYAMVLLGSLRVHGRLLGWMLLVLALLLAAS